MRKIEVAKQKKIVNPCHKWKRGEEVEEVWRVENISKSIRLFFRSPPPPFCRIREMESWASLT